MKYLLLFFLISLLLISCSKNKSAQPLPSSNVKVDPFAITSKFLDSPVKGIDFILEDGTKGVTGVRGEFSCKIGELVQFSLFKTVPIGVAVCAPVIHVFQLGMNKNQIQATLSLIVAVHLTTYPWNEILYPDIDVFLRKGLDITGYSIMNSGPSIRYDRNYIFQSAPPESPEQAIDILNSLIREKKRPSDPDFKFAVVPNTEISNAVDWVTKYHLSKLLNDLDTGFKLKKIKDWAEVNGGRSFTLSLDQFRVLTGNQAECGSTGLQIRLSVSSEILEYLDPQTGAMNSFTFAKINSEDPSFLISNGLVIDDSIRVMFKTTSGLDTYSGSVYLKPVNDDPNFMLATAVFHSSANDQNCRLSATLKIF